MSTRMLRVPTEIYDEMKRRRDIFLAKKQIEEAKAVIAGTAQFPVDNRKRSVYKQKTEVQEEDDAQLAFEANDGGL
jgi:hypothetical protein